MEVAIFLHKMMNKKKKRLTSKARREPETRHEALTESTGRRGLRETFPTRGQEKTAVHNQGQGEQRDSGDSHGERNHWNKTSK